MATTPYKAVTLRPLTGPLDSRSTPEDVPPLSFRMKLNMQVDESDRLGRDTGWEKLLSQTPYRNQDAHDQGDCLEVFPVREPQTFIREVVNNLGIRRLLRGSRSRVAMLSESTGEWTILARDFGGDTTSNQVYWQAAQSGNTMVFTNKVDKPQAWTVGTTPSSCGGSSFSEIADLNTLKVTAAGVVSSFFGSIFLMDVTQDGVRIPNRVRWSGVNKPLIWVPGAGTVANFQDLPSDEVVLAAVPLQGNLIIFTDKSIYRCFVAGESFGFTQVYTEPKSRDKCLVYPRTLVSDGNGLWWRGQDGFYRWDIYKSEPERPEWLWRCSNLTDDLDPTCCDGPVGEYNPVRKTIYWSWPKAGDSCLPYRTLKANLRVQTASLIDHGFSAFANFRSDQRETLDEWLDTHCTTDFLSLCASIGAATVDDLCRECNQRQLFVGASTEDYCLKELGDTYSRERCTNAATGEGGFDSDGNYRAFAGEYEHDGYFSVVRAMMPLGVMDKEKSANQILLDPTVVDLLGDAAYWRVRIGTSFQARDCNPAGNAIAFAYDTDDLAPEWEAEFATDGGRCEVLWKRMSDKEVRCPDDMTTAQYLARNIRPVSTPRWFYSQRGRFLYWELSVVGKNGSGQVVPPVGAAFTLGRVELYARVLQV